MVKQILKEENNNDKSTGNLMSLLNGLLPQALRKSNLENYNERVKFIKNLEYEIIVFDSTLSDGTTYKKDFTPKLQ